MELLDHPKPFTIRTIYGSHSLYSTARRYLIVLRLPVEQSGEHQSILLKLVSRQSECAHPVDCPFVICFRMPL